MVLPDTPGGSPAARKWQVNGPLTRNNDLPYGFQLLPILSQTLLGLLAGGKHSAAPG